jgi:hypothetical protein
LREDAFFSVAVAALPLWAGLWDWGARFFRPAAFIAVGGAVGATCAGEAAARLLVSAFVMWFCPFLRATSAQDDSSLWFGEKAREK